MNHFVCTECRVVSKTAGTCQTDGCLKSSMPLAECHCEDGEHSLVLRAPSEDVSESVEEPVTQGPTTVLDLDSSDN